MVGTPTPKRSAIFFWVNQKVSPSNNTSTRTVPSGVAYKMISWCNGACPSSVISLQPSTIQFTRNQRESYR